MNNLDYSKETEIVAPPPHSIILFDNFFHYYDGKDVIFKSEKYYQACAVWKDNDGKFWRIDPKDSDWSDYGNVFSGRNDIKIVETNVILLGYCTPNEGRDLHAFTESLK